MPAWKITKCIQILNAKPIDFAHIAAVTKIQLASNDLVAVAAKCLAELSNVSSEDASTSAGDTVTNQSASGPGRPAENKTQSAESKSTEHKQSEETTEQSSKQQGEDGFPGTTSEKKQGDVSQSKYSSDQRAAAQDSTQQSSSAVTTDQRATAQGGASTSTTSGTKQGADKGTTRTTASTCSAHKKPDYKWISQPTGLKGTHDILWPSEPTSTSPSLITGLVLGERERLTDNLMDWASKLESADLEGHKKFIEKAGLPTCDSPLEATAWENGFVPEAMGIQTDRLEQRIQGSLPPLACLVSRPRQPIDTGEDLLRRYDPAVRPYWLRDWQSGFGGYTRCMSTRFKEKPSGNSPWHM